MLKKIASSTDNIKINPTKQSLGFYRLCSPNARIINTKQCLFLNDALDQCLYDILFGNSIVYGYARATVMSQLYTFQIYNNSRRLKKFRRFEFVISDY